MYVIARKIYVVSFVVLGTVEELILLYLQRKVLPVLVFSIVLTKSALFISEARKTCQQDLRVTVSSRLLNTHDLHRHLKLLSDPKRKLFLA
jgi:hypothetical protein